MERRSVTNVYSATFVGDSMYFEYGTPVTVHEHVRSFDAPVRAGETRCARTASADVVIGRTNESPWFGISFTNVLDNIKFLYVDG